MASEYETNVREVGDAVRSVVFNVLRRRAAGESLSDEQVIASRPELADQLRTELAKLQQICAAGINAENADQLNAEHQSDVILASMIQWPAGAEAATCSHDGRFDPGEQQDDGAVEPKPTRKGSRGLRIRCPHCSNFVEVLTDTPYEEISCGTCGSCFSLVDRDESTRLAAPLKSIDRFDLVTRVGVGGFGTVWKARDRELDRTVAVKIPRRGQLSPAETDQFFREARAAAQLHHPNIVPIHEVGRDGDTLFIVSDLVRGVTLSDRFTGSAISAREVVELCVPIADALHHAHQQGVVHRDLKPSNIMIDESGQPHLTDFGLAKREVGEITMTVDGQVLGTPSYMSPEQAAGHSHWTDRRTDIYSFGVILFQLLTGELPFRGNAQMQIHQRLTEDAPHPRKLNRQIPRDLATICLKCLEREPGSRYATSAELADELRRFLRGEPIRARPLSTPARLVRWAKRKPLLATTAALTMFLAVAGPLAAIHIARQRAELEVRLTERNDLIETKGREIRDANAIIDQLRTQVDTWEGRANPSEFWPRKPDKPTRQKLVAKLLERTEPTLSNQLRTGKLKSDEKARGYLGLAAMADVVGLSAKAQEYYELARDELLMLQQRDPSHLRYAKAIAECYTHIARLTEKSNPDDSATNYENARAIYERLAADHTIDTMAQVDWLESELNSAILAGLDSGEKNLNRAARINAILNNNWPTAPNAVYELACYLTQTNPTLSELPGDEVPAATGKAATLPND